MSAPSPITPHELITRYQTVRSDITGALDSIPADACFRGQDRPLLDIVEELLRPGEADDYLAQLDRSSDRGSNHESHITNHEYGVDLGAAPDWESRRELILCRYSYAVQAVINFARSFQDGQFCAPLWSPPLLGLLLPSYQHDADFGITLRQEHIPRALKHRALAPISRPTTDPEAHVERRRDDAATEMEDLAQGLHRLLAPLTHEQASRGHDPQISDLLLRCSDKHQLLRMAKRLLIEDHLKLGAPPDRRQLWNAIWPTLIDQMITKAQRWRETQPARLRRLGTLGGQLYSVIMAIEEITARYRQGAHTIKAKLERLGSLVIGH